MRRSMKTPTTSEDHRPAAQKPAKPEVDTTYLRAANEDDDGYDPYSDRPATPEPLFERDPWA